MADELRRALFDVCEAPDGEIVVVDQTLAPDDFDGERSDD